METNMQPQITTISTDNQNELPQNWEKQGQFIKALQNPSMTTVSVENESVGDEIDNTYPIGAFPIVVRKLMVNLFKCLGFPIDYIGTSILYAISLGFGKNYLIKVRGAWEDHGALFFALVGNPGDYKTPVLSRILEPIKKIDERNAAIYKAERIEYEKQLKEYNRAIGSRNNDTSGDLIEPVKPKLKKNFYKDFTIEALITGHADNPRGIGIYSDELLSVIGDFERYTKGSDQKKLLSIWSRDSISVDRKSAEPIYISNPFVSMIGGIQIRLLKDLAKQNRNYDGFMDRILFAYPDDLTRKNWCEEDVCESYLIEWNNIINRLFEMPENIDEWGNIKPTIIGYNEGANKIRIDWFNSNVSDINNPINEDMRGVNSKLDISINRIALIIQMLRYACNEATNNQVDEISIQSAIDLIEYYRVCAEKVNKIINNKDSGLPDKKIEFLKLLPDTFTTKQANEVFGEYNKDIKATKAANEKYVQRFIEANLGERFRRVSHGVYKKL